jgi:hypothetical protein
MFTIDEHSPVMRKVGIRREIFETMDKLDVGHSFVVPLSVYAHVSVRARVSEYNKELKKNKSTRNYRAHLEQNGTRIMRNV